MKDQKIVNLIVVLILGAVLSACTGSSLKSVGSAATPADTSPDPSTSSPQDSSISFINYQVGKATEYQVITTLNYKARNTNSTDLRNISVKYTLYAKGKSFYNANRPNIVLLANQTKNITVPVTVNYKTLFNVVSKSSAKSIQITAKVSIVGDSTNFTENTVFAIPVPKKDDDEDDSKHEGKGDDDDDDDDKKKKDKDDD